MLKAKWVCPAEQIYTVDRINDKLGRNFINFFLVWLILCEASDNEIGLKIFYNGKKKLFCFRQWKWGGKWEGLLKRKLIMENVFAIIFHVPRLCMRQITMNNEVESPESQFEIESTGKRECLMETASFQVKNENLFGALKSLEFSIHFHLN